MRLLPFREGQNELRLGGIRSYAASDCPPDRDDIFLQVESDSRGMRSADRPTSMAPWGPSLKGSRRCVRPLPIVDAGARCSRMPCRSTIPAFADH